jgi:ATP-dependent DNA helicase RecQ
MPATTATDLSAARAALERTFGYPDFRGGQVPAVSAVLEGRDVLVLMPTGGGKSLCFQVPALVLPGLTLVVSPLISLMQDQVEVLRRKGVPAELLNSTLTREKSAAALDAAARGELRLLYVAPERFASESFRARVRELNVSLLAVDEAHCISQWGHEFRPSYRRLGGVRELFDCPVIALTATATPTVRRDIREQLRLRDPVEVVNGFDRANLSWHVLAAERNRDRDDLLLALLRRPRDGVAIVYASTRQRVDGVADLLNRQGMACIAYHAGIRGVERHRLQEAFMRGAAPIVVATSAFGMGIDKPNVRLVIHHGMPADLESYYQEAGRGGRDGGPSECVLLHAYRDRFTHEFLIGQNHPERPVVEAVLGRLRELSDADMLATLGGGEELAKALAGAANAAQALAAVRVLVEAGVLERAPIRAGAPWIRLLASPARIRRELGACAVRTDQLALLRALYRRHGEALYDGVRLAPRDPVAADAAALEALQAEGFVAWRPPALEPGVRFAAATPPDGATADDTAPNGGERGGAAPALDWALLDGRRAAARRRLDAMQGYAYTRECRRSFVLRYFGEAPPRRNCGNCDRCLGRRRPLLPGAAPPRQRWVRARP